LGTLVCPIFRVLGKTLKMGQTSVLGKTLKMGQTSVPETLVAHQKLTPGYNPKLLSNKVNTVNFHVNRMAR
jgi:hypothetical protein